VETISADDHLLGLENFTNEIDEALGAVTSAIFFCILVVIM
jgi:hypothetical protein